MKDAGIKNAAAVSDVQMKMTFGEQGGNTGTDVPAVPAQRSLCVLLNKRCSAGSRVSQSAVIRLFPVGGCGSAFERAKQKLKP